MSRFPYICYENGGGTFLLPYLVCLVLCGLPLYFMEMLLGQVRTNHSTASGHVTPVLTSDWPGQYAGSSCTKVFARLAPVMKGLGYGILSIPTMMTFYYTLIMSWAFYYMFQGFRQGCCYLGSVQCSISMSRSVLPWRSCVSSVLADYTTQFCYSKWDHDQCVAENNTTIFYNKVKLLMDS